MKNKIYVLILTFILVLSGLSDLQADPFVWACGRPLMGGSGCIMTYLYADSAYNLCSGDTLSLYATKSDDAATSYQWYERYTYQEHSSIPPWYIDGPIEAETMRELVITKTDETRAYWCKVMVLLSDPYLTQEVQTYWSDGPPVIMQDLSNESCCENSELSLNFRASGHNLYTWEVKSNLPGSDWEKVFSEYRKYSSSYKFNPNIIDHLSQIKCTAINGCGELASSISTLTVFESPDLDLPDDRHICKGDTLVLDAGSGMTDYNWSTGDKSQTYSVLESGTYWVTVTNPYTCKSSDTVVIIVDPLIPPLNMQDEQRACLGDYVTLNAGDTYDSYYWNTEASTQILQATTSGEYYVEVSINNNACIEYGTVNVIIAEPYPDEKICIVTVDLATGKNMVVWEKTQDQGTLGYHIYRETIIGQYELIGQVMNPDLSIFKDTLVSPENQSYLYKITSVDTCGNESELDDNPYHKPIFLKYLSSDKGVNLEWTDYEIYGVADLGDYLTSFEIYRGSDSTALTLYKEVGSINNYTDTDPNALVKHYYYRVAGVLKDPCYASEGKKAGTGPYHHSLSNMDDNKLKTGFEGLLSAERLKIYPNPLVEKAIIQFANPEHEVYQLILTDLTGKVLRIMDNITDDKIEINRDGLSDGLYLIELRGPKLYRGKVLIK